MTASSITAPQPYRAPAFELADLELITATVIPGLTLEVALDMPEAEETIFARPSGGEPVCALFREAGCVRVEVFTDFIAFRADVLHAATVAAALDIVREVVGVRPGGGHGGPAA